MKPVSGFKAEAPAQGYPMLPKGLYIAQIKNVQIEGTEPDQSIRIRVDIVEGEYTGYYTNRYNNDRNLGGQYEVKYKGDYLLQIPNEQNPKRQHHDWDLRTFNGAIWAIEDSNPGYHWDWNEQGLKGKFVGLNVRQGMYNGNEYTRIGRLESVQMIKAGKVKVMKDSTPRSDDGAPAAGAGGAAPGFVMVEEDIPF